MHAFSLMAFRSLCLFIGVQGLRREHVQVLTSADGMSSTLAPRAFESQMSSIDLDTYVSCTDRHEQDQCLADSACLYLSGLQLCLPRCSVLPVNLCSRETMCYTLEDVGGCVNHCTAGDLVQDKGQLTLSTHNVLGAIQRDAIACALCANKNSCDFLQSVGQRILRSSEVSGFPRRTDDHPEHISCRWIHVPSQHEIEAITTHAADKQWTYSLCVDARLPITNSNVPALAAISKTVKDMHSKQLVHDRLTQRVLCELRAVTRFRCLQPHPNNSTSAI
eukprot:Gregarina_sp_Poly_1__6137@NODE_3240_length_1245_cov_13_722411_g2059_i0_p1_GENE_NODE_3240_length_1245_cov_13_722411_g2059_i0NODE_3240_length_1245_cov_13_722411_g2059_i0_p1_ORF_typecomplete_len277_score8_03zfCCCH_3/PF15663_5/2zfCCCH_3/PF15663_5/7_6e02zfCCCH_3/PF15663_5/2_6e03_NODE_3240_length_1245_cov_13_722411_g2059_i0161991